MEAERNRSRETGFNKSASVERRRRGIRPNTKRLHHQAEQEGEEAALKSALTSRVNDNKFIVVDDLNFDAIKTKNFKAVMDNLKVSKALVVLDDGNNNAVLSARNLPTVKTAWVNTINVYDILKYNTVVATKAAVANIEEVYA